MPTVHCRTAYLRTAPSWSSCVGQHRLLDEMAFCADDNYKRLPSSRSRPAPGQRGHARAICMWRSSSKYPRFCASSCASSRDGIRCNTLKRMIGSCFSLGYVQPPLRRVATVSDHVMLQACYVVFEVIGQTAGGIAFGVDVWTVSPAAITRALQVCRRLIRRFNSIEPSC
jgi:hypothetical protein